MIVGISFFAEADELPGKLTNLCEIEGVTAESISSAVNSAKDGTFDGATDENRQKALEASAFIGIYDGKWSGKLQHTLIVYEIEGVDDDIIVHGFYTWGIYKQWNIKKSGCQTVTGYVHKENLRFLYQDRDDYFVSYRLKDGGKSVKGLYKKKTRGTFERIM